MRGMTATGVGVCLAGLLLATAEAQQATAPAPARGGATNSEVYRVSDILGMPVKNEEGQVIGKIKDLVVDGATQEVLYAVLDAEGQQNVFVMPWNVFQPVYGAPQAVQYTTILVPRSVWIGGPSYGWSQWRSMPYSSWGPQVNTYFENHAPDAGRGKSGGKYAGEGKKDETARDDKTKKDATKKEDANHKEADEKREAEPKSATKPSAGQKSGERPQGESKSGGKGSVPSKEGGASKGKSPLSKSPRGK